MVRKVLRGAAGKKHKFDAAIQFLRRKHSLFKTEEGRRVR